MSTSEKQSKNHLRIMEFMRKNEAKFALLLGFLLTSGISFGAGMLNSQKWQSSKPLIIEKPVFIQSDVKEVSDKPKEISDNYLKDDKKTVSSENCMYVGSKNSTKFYLSNCSWAKKIKPENIVCFTSANMALEQGRTESKCN